MHEAPSTPGGFDPSLHLVSGGDRNRRRWLILVVVQDPTHVGRDLTGAVNPSSSGPSNTRTHELPLPKTYFVIGTNRSAEAVLEVNAMLDKMAY
jgi:hypothetical protein